MAISLEFALKAARLGSGAGASGRVVVGDRGCGVEEFRSGRERVPFAGGCTDGTAGLRLVWIACSDSSPSQPQPKPRKQRIRCEGPTKSDIKLVKDLQEFVFSLGLPPLEVPTTKELARNGRQDLANAVRRRGYKVVAQLLKDHHDIDFRNSPTSEQAAAPALDSATQGATRNGAAGVPPAQPTQTILSVAKDTVVEFSDDGLKIGVPPAQVGQTSISDGNETVVEAPSDEPGVGTPEESGLISSYDSKETAVEVSNDEPASRSGFSAGSPVKPENMNGHVPYTGAVVGGGLDDQLVRRPKDFTASDKSEPSGPTLQYKEAEPTKELGLIRSKDFAGASQILDLVRENSDSTGASQAYDLAQKNLDLAGSSQALELARKNSTSGVDNHGSDDNDDYESGSDGDDDNYEEDDDDDDDRSQSGISSHHGFQSIDDIAAQKAALLKTKILQYLDSRSEELGQPKSNQDQDIFPIRLAREQEKAKVVMTDNDSEGAQSLHAEKELNRFKDLLEVREMVLAEVERELEEAKAQFALARAKATAELLHAKQIASEKEALLVAAEQALAQLKQVHLEWWGEAERVELAGSFNGWQHYLLMEPDLSSEIPKPDGSRGPMMWGIHLCLYPGVYEIKFIVDGVWQVDHRREFIMRHMNQNNVLRVE